MPSVEVPASTGASAVPRKVETTETRGATVGWWIVGVGAGLALLQALLAVFDPPAESFRGSRADYVADTLWAAALLLTLVGYWNLKTVRAGRVWPVAVNAGLGGQLALAAAVAATVVAGREMLDLLFILGFAVVTGAALVLAIVARSWLLGLLVPALVLSLAFFAEGGAAAFGAVWLALAIRRRP